jgi:hypothetical protein
MGRIVRTLAVVSVVFAVVFAATFMVCMRFGPEPKQSSDTDRGRSGKWPAVRNTYLADHTACEACGCDEDLDVHHVDSIAFGGEELDPANLITLCNKHHCHLMLGHLGNFRSSNPNVRADAARCLDRVQSRPYSKEEARKFVGRFTSAL